MGGAGRAAVTGRVALERGAAGGRRRRLVGGVDVAGDRPDDPVRRDLADQVVVGVGDEDRPVGLHEHPLGAVQIGAAGRATVAAEALGLGRPGHGLDDERVGLQVDRPDHVVRRVAEVQDVVDDHHLLRVLDAGAGGRDVVAGRRRLEAGPGEGGDRPGRVDPPEAVVLAVGDVDVALRVDGDAVGLVEAGLDGRAAVTAVLGARVDAGERIAVGVRRRAPGHRADDALSVDLPDPLVERVGEVEVAAGVKGKSPRVVDGRLGGRAAVATEAALGVVLGRAGERPDGAGRVSGVGAGAGRGQPEAGNGKGRNEGGREPAPHRRAGPLANGVELHFGLLGGVCRQNRRRTELEFGLQC